MSDTPTPRTDSLMEEWHHCPPTKQLLNHSRQLERELADTKVSLEKSLFECDQIESSFRSKLHKLESDLFAQTAAAHRAKTALIAITTAHFYQSSCRGGEMERLMNQAIDVLGGGK